MTKYAKNGERICRESDWEVKLASASNKRQVRLHMGGFITLHGPKNCMMGNLAGYYPGCVSIYSNGKKILRDKWSEMDFHRNVENGKWVV